MADIIVPRRGQVLRLPIEEPVAETEDGKYHRSSTSRRGVRPVAVLIAVRRYRRRHALANRIVKRVVAGLGGDGIACPALSGALRLGCGGAPLHGALRMRWGG